MSLSLCWMKCVSGLVSRLLVFSFTFLNLCPSPPQYKASKEGTVMGVAVSKISMLTHCQALTQACNYCEGQSLTLTLACHFS